MYTMYTSQQPAGRYKVTEFTDMIWAHGRQSRTAVWRGQPGSGFARGQRAQVQVLRRSMDTLSVCLNATH